MIQPSNTSRRVLIRFPMLTLQTITDDLSSVMLHTGYAIIISAFERSKPQEPKVWTPLVLRVWNFRHDTTLSCLVFSVKTVEKITSLEKPCSKSRSNIFTTSFISTIHNCWYRWLKNPKKPCLTQTPWFDFAETGCCAPIRPDVTSIFVGWFRYKKSARPYGVLFPPCSQHILLYHITSISLSYHIISYHITSNHIISYHIISYHIIYHILQDQDI